MSDRWTEDDLKALQARRAGSREKVKKLGRSRANTRSGRVEPVERDGIRFDSLREANRYSELKLLKELGEIFDLRYHVRFPLVVNEALICQYEADFVYYRVGSGRVVEDAKGWKTDLYRLKKKLFEALYETEIVEV